MPHKCSESSRNQIISRREFFKQVSNLGLATALPAALRLAQAGSLPLALKVFLDFNQKIWAEDKSSKSVTKLIEAQYYEKLADNKIKCTLCPNFHIYAPGERSFCFTRVNHKGMLMSHAYNNPCTISVDPIEKGPFNHFLPDTNSLAIAIGGCNLRCLYCQNWQVSMEKPEKTAKCDWTKEDALDGVNKKECRTICYTYTEPMVYPEYVREVSAYTSSKGIRNLICTAAFVNPQPLKDICKNISGFAVTLKAFNDKFYQKICGQSLGTILQSMEIIKAEKKHLEIVNLIVPSYNDDLEVIKKMCQWIKKNLGQDTPLHFGRFHAEYKLKDLPDTPVKTVEQARQIAFDEGLKHVYTFNIAPHEGNNTYCPACKQPVIKRLAFKVLENNLPKGSCKFCGHKLAGVWQ